MYKRILIAITCVSALSCYGGPLPEDEAIGAVDGDDVAVVSSENELQLLFSAARFGTNIPVCFMSGASLTQQLAWVKSAIENSWAANARISFFYPTSCPTTGMRIEVHMRTSWTDDQGVDHEILDDNGIGGGSGYPGPSGTSLTLYACSNSPAANCPNQEEIFKSVAVHEFGHALGFTHEHQRVDAPFVKASLGNNQYRVEWPSWCAPGANESQAALEQNWLPINGWELTAYDPNSIMNYCRDVNGNQLGDRREPTVPGIQLDALSNRDRDGIQAAYGFRDTSAAPTPSSYSCGANEPLYFGDFDADGQSDYLCKNSARIRVRFANSSTPVYTSNTSWCTGSQSYFMIGDRNGDNRDDLVCVNETGIYIDYASSNTSSLFGTVDWQTTTWKNVAGVRHYIGNFDGQVGDDLVRFDFTNKTVGIDYFGFNPDWSSSFAGVTCLSENPPHERMADVTADGRDDVICQSAANGNAWFAFTTTMSGHWSLASPMRLPAFRDWRGGCTLASMRLGDLDGDRKIDFVCRRSDGLSVRFGSSFANPTTEPWWSQSNADWSGPVGAFCSATGTELALLRHNSDTRDDFVCYKRDFSSLAWAVLPSTFHAL